MRGRAVLQLAVAWSVLVAVHSGARAATITGRVTLPDGRPLMERFVYGNAIYGGTAHAYDYLGTGDNGYYSLDNLPAGTYAVAVVDPWHARAQIVTNIQVTSAQGTYTVDVPLRATYYSPDDNWPSDPHWRWLFGGPDFAQSFVADGPYVVHATIRDAEWGANKEIEVSVCTSPMGQPIGPARKVRSGAGHGETSWAGGEVPVTRGQTYFLRARSTDGSGWAPGLGCVPYPYGMMYVNGAAQPDLDMTWEISCDDDGLVSSYYITRHKDHDEAGQEALEWGQTFVARSLDIQFASAHMFSPGTCDLDFFIREGGFSGGQIGPTRTARIENEVGRDQTGGVLWGPGEVPVMPGRTYYLGVRRHEGGTIRLYRWPERYSQGSAYHDGIAETNWDLETQILGAEPPPGQVLTSLALRPGWNLVSLPLEPADGDPAVVFGSISIDGRLFRYLPDEGYRTYLAADPASFGGDLRRGEGYWIYVDASSRITYYGQAQEGPQAVPLSPPGWHLMGSAQTTAAAVVDCQFQIGRPGAPPAVSLDSARRLGWLDPTFHWYDPTRLGYTVTGAESWELPNFVAWRGYWVWASLPDLEMVFP
jgi:hypothetical protein